MENNILIYYIILPLKFCQQLHNTPMTGCNVQAFKHYHECLISAWLKDSCSHILNKQIKFNIFKFLLKHIYSPYKDISMEVNG